LKPKQAGRTMSTAGAHCGSGFGAVSGMTVMLTQRAGFIMVDARAERLYEKVWPCTPLFLNF
jgi:hypothetical protein